MRTEEGGWSGLSVGSPALRRGGALVGRGPLPGLSDRSSLWLWTLGTGRRDPSLKDVEGTEKWGREERSDVHRKFRLLCTTRKSNCQLFFFFFKTVSGVFKQHRLGMRVWFCVVERRFWFIGKANQLHGSNIFLMLQFSRL